MTLSSEEKKARNRAAQKKYREKYPEKIKKYQEQYRKEHQEKKIEYSRNYYQNNKETFQENSKEYYINNVEKLKQKSLNFYYVNKEGGVKEYRSTEEYIQEHKAYNKQYYAKNTEQEKARQKEYSKTLKGRFRTVKGGAKSRNISFELSFEDFSKEAIKPCFYCNDYFRKELGCGGGLDRIDSARGYTIVNVVSCCAHCNYLKNKSYSVEQTKAMVSALVELDNKKVISSSLLQH